MPPRARRRLTLGHTEDGREFSLAVRGRNVLISGDAKSGKSWVAGLLCEQSILQGYCLCIIDPEGDYVTLADRYGHVVVDAAASEHELPLIAARVRQHGERSESVAAALVRRPH